MTMIRVEITETVVLQKDYDLADLAHLCQVKGTALLVADWVDMNQPVAVEVDMKSSCVGPGEWREQDWTVRVLEES